MEEVAEVTRPRTLWTWLKSGDFRRDRARPPAGRGVVLLYGDDPRRRHREGIGENHQASVPGRETELGLQSDVDPRARAPARASGFKEPCFSPIRARCRRRRRAAYGGTPPPPPWLRTRLGENHRAPYRGP